MTRFRPGLAVGASWSAGLARLVFEGLWIALLLFVGAIYGKYDGDQALRAILANPAQAEAIAREALGE